MVPGKYRFVHHIYNNVAPVLTGHPANCKRYARIHKQDNARFEQSGQNHDPPHHDPNERWHIQARDDAHNNAVRAQCAPPGVWIGTPGES